VVEDSSAKKDAVDSPAEETKEDSKMEGDAPDKK
jgi:hypothetical protein